MIEFNKIYIEGFCSITSLEIPLNTQKITIVRGPNGYGKVISYQQLYGFYMVKT